MDIVTDFQRLSYAHPQALKRGLARLFANPEREKRQKERKRKSTTEVIIEPPLNAAGVEWFSFHDCRRTISTHINRLGFHGLDKFILGHAAAGVTDVHYMRYRFDDELTKALKTWGTAVDMTVANPDQEKVVQIDFS